MGGNESIGQRQVQPGDWVILKGRDIIYSNKDLRKVMKKAEDLGEDDITVSKEPSANACFY
jgi:hypothetical protein